MVYEIAEQASDKSVAKVTELRLHGVGGTAPEDILENPHLKLDSGDRHAGFYQPVTRTDEEGPWHQREALSWGRLTAGDFTRALWVFLLPFALVNLAGWMHPPGKVPKDSADPHDQRTRSLVVKSLVRLFSASVTFAFVLMLFTLLTDLIAYQCGSKPACRETRWWLAPLGWSHMATHSTSRLVMGAILCFAVLGLLHLAGRKSFQELEQFPTGASGSDDPALSLRSRAFWDGKGPVGRLRSLHWSVGLTAVSWLLSQSAPTLRFSSGEVFGVTDGTVGSIFNVLCLMVVLSAAAIIGASQTYRRRDTVWVDPGIRTLHRGAIALSLLALVYAAVPGQASDSLPPRLEVIDTFARNLVLVQVSLLLSLFVTLLVIRKRREVDEEPGFWGLGSFVVATLGMFLLAASWAGGTIRIADLLGCPLKDTSIAECSNTDSRTNVVVTEPAIYYSGDHEMTAVGFLTVMAAIALGVGQMIWRHRRRSTARHARVESDFGLTAPVSPEDRRQLKKFARKYEPWRLVKRADVVVTCVILVGAATAVVLNVPALLSMEQRYVHGALAKVVQPWQTGIVILVWILTIMLAVRGWSIFLTILLAIPNAMATAELTTYAPLITFSAWAVTFLPLALSAGMYAALRQPRWRRHIGVAWDVVTFWPRHFHPFAPPCYGERLIPQLRYRLEELTRSHDGKDCGRVLLSSHSQGTVIAVAALLEVDDNLKPRIMLFTYGSPLEILYRRYYPAYFGGGILSALGAELAPSSGPRPARWQHYYCNTDPLGYPMFESAPDLPPDDLAGVFTNTRLLDPVRWRATPGTPPLKMYRHSAYLRHTEFKRFVRAAVRRLAEELDGDCAGLRR